VNRSVFLKKLIASITIGKLPVSVTSSFRKIYLLQCFVAGFRYYEGMQQLDRLKEGDLLELVREPDNAYDRYTVALHWRGIKIGFIPSSINEMLSFLLDADALSLFAVITHLERNAQPWENVAVAVYFIQEVNKKLPAHASYLTRIEAPHYRTLKRKTDNAEKKQAPTVDDLYNCTNRVLNLDAIPTHQKEAREYFEKHYSSHPVSITKPGRFVQVKDDEIFTYMYEISDEISLVKNDRGMEFLEFFLVS
jgi:hypothetical protein